MKRTDGKSLSENDLKTFVKFMSLGDIGNSDAFGFFNDKKVFKEEGKFDYRTLNAADIISSHFVVGHNRLATNKFYFAPCNTDCEPEPVVKNKLKKSIFIQNNYFIHDGLPPFGGFILNGIRLVPEKIKGKKQNKEEPIIAPEEIEEEEVPTLRFNNNVNNHPFELGDLILVHNGVISNAGSLMEEHKVSTEITTDSFIVIFLINKFLKEFEAKGKKGSRSSLIAEAIKRTTNLISGSYSIFLFDKKENKLYYFKNNRSIFYFYKPNKDMIVGSTVFTNFEHIYNNKEVYNELIKPKSGKIYLVNSGKNKQSFLQELGVFETYFKKRKRKKQLEDEEDTEEKKGFLRHMFRKLKGGKKKE